MHGRLAATPPPKDGGIAQPRISAAPSASASRRRIIGDGMAAEIVRVAPGGRIDIQFHAPAHLLVLVEQGVRAAGETSIEGLPPSSLRNLKGKFSFVPAGHAYKEWQKLSAPYQAMYLWFDPQHLPSDRAANCLEALRTPRLFFDDPVLRQTALKLMRLIENSSAERSVWFDALGVVLLHDLVQPTSVSRQSSSAVRGGLAAWQERLLIDYIEQNVAKRISLAELAQLVRLSTYHLCRAFKQSFGVPPHQYHIGLRMQRAQELLSTTGRSMTEIGFALGFSDSSSFSTAFRKAIGVRPTEYRRSA